MRKKSNESGKGFARRRRGKKKGSGRGGRGIEEMAEAGAEVDTTKGGGVVMTGKCKV